MNVKKENRIAAAEKGTRLPIPFSISITPMEALLFTTFEQDPDSVYSAFEAQRFDDDMQGYWAAGHWLACRWEGGRLP